MIDRGSGSGLPAFVQPEARDHRRKIWTPDTLHEGRPFSGRHRAGRGAENIGHAGQHIARAAARTDGADAAGMCIDEARRYRCARFQSQFCRGLRRQSGPERRPARHDIGADPRELFIGEHTETDTPEIGVVPALLMGKIGPFAGDRADGARQAFRAAPCEEIGQIEELPGRRESAGHMFSKPEQFRCLHLGRNGAADIAQHGLGARVDAPGLVDGAMVHPHDDVAFGIARRTDRHGPTALAQHDQRAGRVEAQPRHRARRNAGRRDRLANAAAHRAPDIVARLLHDVAGLAPEADIGLRRRQHRAGRIEHTCPCAARPDVDAYEMLRHGNPTGRRCWAGSPGRARRRCAGGSA